MNLKIIYILILPIFLNLHSKILIFTHSYNRPEFIELQYKTFKKFLKDDYEFIVFNDAIVKKNYNDIHKECSKLNIKCIDIPQKIHETYICDCKPLSKASERNCNVIRWSLEQIGFNHNGIVAVIDSDLFLIKDFSITKYMENHSLAAWLRTCKETHKGKCKIVHPDIPQKIEYIWFGLMFFDMRRFPNKKTFTFDCAHINNAVLDSGGSTYKFLKDNPNLNLRKINKYKFSDFLCQDCKFKPYINCTHNTQALKNLNFNPKLINLIQNIPMLHKRDSELFLNDTFLHYRGGSAYKKQDEEYLNKKNMLITNFLKQI